MMRYLIVLLISLSLAGCKTNVFNTSVCPDKTTLEIGVTETDAKNDKLQQKQSITQTWKWGKKSCKDN